MRVTYEIHRANNNEYSLVVEVCTGDTRVGKYATLKVEEILDGLLPKILDDVREEILAEVKRVGIEGPSFNWRTKWRAM